MNVVISPNIKKESVRIDPAGNEINARTKQIIKPVEEEYVPPPAAVEKVIESSEIIASREKPVSKIDEMINRKIEELVAKKIEEALGKL